ncbi:Pathogenesis-related leaf protein 6 [Trichinella zimbabwensis]|uniref:Pathogenesis-related leaf protein 6 n=1 Tax=Trichinella zimbabwensis TaxID=268475 RepID=A0A0V1I4V2_9BILA|nr:Pathogenesis-related leaf protein 6 [Trichinella zimbabwensis]
MKTMITSRENLFNYHLILCCFLLCCFKSVSLAHFHSDITSLPFNALQQSRFIWAFNQWRSRLDAGNMQCITVWNANLAEYAQSLAETCSLLQTRLGSNGITRAVRPALYDIPTAAEIVEQFYVDGSKEYNYEDNVCTQETGNCLGFKQFAWHDATEIGCGLARCNYIDNKSPGGYLAICAYNSRASAGKPPFAPKPSCSSCPLSNSNCYSGLCCPFDWKKPQVRNCASKPNRESLVPVHRFYSQKTATNLLITDEKQVAFLKRQGMPYKGVIGKVVRSAEDSSCPHLKPVHHIFSEAFSGDYYTVDELIYKGFINKDSQDFGPIGYGVAAQGICDASIPIFEFYHKLGIVQLPNSTEMNALLKNDKIGFTYRGTSFALWP